MSSEYNPQEVEKKWQAHWSQDQLYQTQENVDNPTLYFLLMFPYPSGPLHSGHWFMYAPSDARARYYRMKGYNVLFPMGFDAFGLPAENAAIKRNLHPKYWTDRNIAQMRRSFQLMGSSFDWDRSVVTCDPAFYKWTQWLFLQMYKNDLAYRKFSPVDWCPHCNTTLAREQVIGDERLCERCDTPVVKKELNQWFFRITKYADELMNFPNIDWPERVMTMQKNWIGPSKGSYINFKSEEGDQIRVFTTRPDTVLGASFMVLAPEHPLVNKLTTAEHHEAVHAYIEQASRAIDIEREAVDREKTGVFIGAYAINPLNNKRIPIYIGDYVLMSYGTGAIMGVPAHDQRDFDFAKKYSLPIPVVISPPNWDGNEFEVAYSGPGVVINSGQFDGTFTLCKYFAEDWATLDEEAKKAFAETYNYPFDLLVTQLQQASKEAKTAVNDYLEKTGGGKFGINYRIRDWLISRQRYWGAPIPMLYCENCGTVPIPEENLPVLLPEDVDFMPTGQSPLLHHQGFLNTTCPVCDGPAQRETDTMDTFVDSSWYWFRYLNPTFEDSFLDPEKARFWLPVAEYAGGIEHATMHLLYARFVTKALRDMGYIDHGEPFSKLFNQGIILGPNGLRMSKSRGNVVDPDEQVGLYGSDAFRTFLMFIGPWWRGGPWSSQGIQGVVRFYQRVWNLVTQPKATANGTASETQVVELQRKLHQTIRDVEQDIEAFAYNTAVASLMKLTNYMYKVKETPIVHHEMWQEAIRTMLLLVAPFGPHIAEELWKQLGYGYSIHQQGWPEYDEALAHEEVFTLIVQINGKVRDKISNTPVSIEQEEAERIATESEKIQGHLTGKNVVRVIYIPQKLVNIVAN